MAVPFQVAEAFVKISAHGLGSVNGQLSALRERMELFENAATGGGSRVIATFGRLAPAALGALVLGKSIHSAIKAFEETEQVLMRLRTVMEGNSERIGWNAEMVETYAKKLQNATKYSTEEIANAATRLATFNNVQGEIYGRTLEAATDLASFLRTDMSAAAMMLGRALEHPGKSFTALEKKGIAFTNSQKEQIRALAESGDALAAQAMILDIVGSKIGKFAESDLNTLSGQFAALSRDIGNLWSEIGKALAPVVMQIVKWTRAVVNGLSFVLQNWRVIWDLAVNSLAHSMALAWDNVKTFFTNIGEGIGWVLENWQKIFQVIGYTAMRNMEFAWEAARTAFQNMVTIGKWALDNFYEIFQTTFSAITTLLTNLGTNIRTFFTAIWEFIKNPSGGFNWDAKPLMEGFVNSISEMPELAQANFDEISERYGKLINDVGLKGPNFSVGNTEEINKRFDGIRAEILRRLQPNEVKPGPGAGIEPPQAKPEKEKKSESEGSIPKPQFFGLEDFSRRLQESMGGRENIEKQVDKAVEALEYINKEGVKVSNAKDFSFGLA